MENTRDLRKIAAYLFLVTSSFGFLQPFLPIYMSAAGLSLKQIGIVSGFGAGLALVIQPILGRWSDRVDARRPFIAGAALCAAGAYSLFPYLQGFWAFFALVALGSNGTMYLNAVGGVIVGRLVGSGSSRGGTVYGGLRMWGSVGYILTSIITGIIVSRAVGHSLDRLAVNPIFHFGPLLFVVIAVLGMTLPDPKSAPKPHGAETKAPLPPNLKRFLLAYFLYCFALYGASSFISLFLKSLGSDGLGITMTFAAGVVVEVLVMRWSGRFSDQFGRRPTLAISFLLLPFRLMLYVPATGPLWVLAVQSLHGVNFGIMGAVAVVFVNDLATEHTRGQAQSRLFAVAGIASAVGPYLLGLVAERWSLPTMFCVAAGFSVIAALVFMLGVEDSHHESESLSDRAPLVLRPLLRWLDHPLKKSR